MKKDFIAKLKTKQFLIGSFDSYQEETKQLIKNNSNLSLENTNQVLANMPASYRATIVNINGEYVGYIGLFHVDAMNHTASIRFETLNLLSEEEQIEILSEFQKYLKESLNITEIEETIYQTKEVLKVDKKEIVTKSNIIIPNKLLVPEITEETLEKFSHYYSIPKLQMPFTIRSKDRVLGIIGLSNVIWSNQRADLNLFLDPELGSDIIEELSGYLIDDYINYTHEANIHNVTLSVTGSDREMLHLLEDTNMNYYGQIPFSFIKGDQLESKMLFQHLPHMKKEHGIWIPENQTIALSALDTEKKQLSECVDLENGFVLMNPKALEKNGIDKNLVLEEHMKAMQERERFTIPLGEDKYFLQKGNGNYGISKAFLNYTYIILDEKKHYAGYINILRNHANGKNAELEIGIQPNLQKKGLGTSVIEHFYEELFSVGYASVTSIIFEFNKPSLKLHERVAKLNGIRLQSYYINGKMWNMNYYSKINSCIEGEKYEKRY